MNWDLIGATGEWAGAIVVVATLFYLARQIRQNTETSRDIAVQTAVSDFAHGTDELNRDPELVRIWFEGRKDFRSLKQLEKQRFALYLTSAFHRHELVLYLSRQGKLDEMAVGGLWAQMEYAFEGQGTRDWWSQSRNLFNSEFQAYCDLVISKVDGRRANT